MAHNRVLKRVRQTNTSSHTHSVIYDYSHVYHLSLHPTETTEIVEQGSGAFAEAVCGKWFRPAFRGLKEPFCRECIKQSRDYYRKHTRGISWSDLPLPRQTKRSIEVSGVPKQTKVKEMVFKPPMENLE
jgi:hypothetical protein